MSNINVKFTVPTMKINSRSIRRLAMCTVVFLGVLMMGWGPLAIAEIIYEENFDGQPDWQVIDRNESCNNVSASCDGSPPLNWTYYRNTENWHPGDGYPSQKRSQEINNSQFRGPSGKSWIRTHESSGTNTSTFGDDSLLLKSLGAEYDEVYVSFWIKMDPNWQWVSSGSAKFKLLRIYHFDGPDGQANPWNYFSGGDSSPIFIMDIKFSNKWGFRSTYSGRCDPQETDYYCNPSRDWEGDNLWQGSPTFKQSLGDGNWHQLQVRVKMNSALGAADGIFTVWLDGVEQYSFTNIPWRENGSSNSIGWNMVGIGGNTTNWYSDPSNLAEQWYAIDDVVISTTYVPTDSASPSVPPPNFLAE